MSIGISGKRVGYEEIFGFSSPFPCSSAKKFRRSSYGSPYSSEPDPTVSALPQMFPSLDREVVERLSRSNNCDVEDAMECLDTLSSAQIQGRDKSKSTDSEVIGNRNAIVDQNQAPSCSRMWEETIEEEKHVQSTTSCGQATDGMNWVDLFVHEMMNAADLDVARGRATRILAAFEQFITAKTRVSDELEHASLKEHLQSLLNDNQILKRTVAAQHERNLEHEEKSKGVQQLKDVLYQYQERLHRLEMNNYALKVHLQRAQENSSISEQFQPDIF